MRKATILLSMLMCLNVQAQGLTFQIKDALFEAGDTVSATFRAYGFENIGGVQFALLADAQDIQLVGIESGAIGEDGNFSWHGKPGYEGVQTPGEIRFVWLATFGETLPDGETLFSIKFVALQNGALSDALEVWHNHPVLALAACTAIPLAPIAFEIAFVDEGQTSAAKEEPNALFNVWPNPFKQSLNVETGGKIEQMGICDLAGATVLDVQPKGESIVEIPFCERLVSGVYVLNGIVSGEAFAVKIVKN